MGWVISVQPPPCPPACTVMTLLADTAHWGSSRSRGSFALGATPRMEALLPVPFTGISYYHTAPSRSCRITSQQGRLRDDSEIKYLCGLMGSDLWALMEAVILFCSLLY